MLSHSSSLLPSAWAVVAAGPRLVLVFGKEKPPSYVSVLEGGFYLLLVLYDNTLLKANSNPPAGGFELSYLPYEKEVCGIINTGILRVFSVLQAPPNYFCTHFAMTNLVLTKIFSLTSLSFLVALVSTPLLTHFLYKYKLGKNIRDSKDTPLFTQMHAAKKGTPTMGGFLVWGITALLVVLFWVLDRVLGLEAFHNLNILSRKETLLPLAAFVGAAVVGMADDLLDINRMGHNGRGMRFRFKVFLYALVAMVGAWWFYFKLGFDAIHIPFGGTLTLGWLFIPFFIFVVIATSFAVNQTDGLDGLAGGTLLIAFFAFGLIAYVRGQENLAALIGIVAGSLLAFLWFNVYPARFFMGDTGSMGLGVLLAIVAFLTNSILLLPVIGLVFVIEAVTTVLQLFWKKVFKRKLFLSAPVHHHFEALGWPETKVTMRAWILASVCALVGSMMYFLG